MPPVGQYTCLSPVWGLCKKYFLYFHFFPNTTATSTVRTAYICARSFPYENILATCIHFTFSLTFLAEKLRKELSSAKSGKCSSLRANRAWARTKRICTQLYTTKHSSDWFYFLHYNRLRKYCCCMDLYFVYNLRYHLFYTSCYPRLYMRKFRLLRVSNNHVIFWDKNNSTSYFVSQIISMLNWITSTWGL